MIGGPHCHCGSTWGSINPPPPCPIHDPDLAARRADLEFMERLRRRVEEDRPLLDRLRD